MTSFSVAAIVREPPDVLERFVGWHLGQGAARIDLYFDDPEDPSAPRFAGDPRIRVVRCTPGFWQAIGTSPTRRFPRRQNRAMTHAYAESEADWMLNIDADELIHIGGRSVAEMLEAAPSDVGAVSIASAEYVRVAGAPPAFRLPVARGMLAEIYGADGPLFRRASGLVGHADGKSFIRRGQAGIRLRQHWAEGDAGRIASQCLGAGEGAYLLHFLQEDFATWRAKVPWRMNSFGFPPEVKAAVAAIEAAETDREEALRGLHRRLSEITAEQAAALEVRGGLVLFNVDFAAVARGALA